MAEFGYARVSTGEQVVDLQVCALVEAGVPAGSITAETASGTDPTRPGLRRLLGQLGEGDRLTVWRFDRVFRSTRHMLELTDDLAVRGVEFRSLRESIDTSTSTGRFFFTVVAAMSQMEADLIRERTSAGLAAAKAAGRQLGRPTSITAAQAVMVPRLLAEGSTQRAAAAATGLSRAAVGRLARGEIATLNLDNGEDPDLLTSLPT